MWKMNCLKAEECPEAWGTGRSQWAAGAEEPGGDWQVGQPRLGRPGWGCLWCLSAQPHPTRCRRATGAQGDMGNQGMPSSVLLQTLAGLAWFPW